MRLLCVGPDLTVEEAEEEAGPVGRGEAPKHTLLAAVRALSLPTLASSGEMLAARQVCDANNMETIIDFCVALGRGCEKFCQERG